MRARHRHFLFPVPNYHTELLAVVRLSPHFFSRVLPACRPLHRARFGTCRRAGAVTRWDEYGIGSGGQYFAGNDAHLDCVNVFYYEASGDMYVPVRCSSILSSA
jgi:hypothetical protein